MGPSPDQIEAAMRQLDENQRVLDYDTKEFTVELLVQKFDPDASDSDIWVPPYQRHFNWDQERQARLIESILVGLPIPFLFFADLEDGRLEVVDGRQRLGTCRAFLTNDLELFGLERLDLLNGFRFEDLSTAQQRRFKNRTIRSVVLSRHATESDRRDLFDRINTGSLIAEQVEIRRGAVPGPVSDLIDSLASDPRFLRLCPMSEASKKKRSGEELVTRFFALLDGLEGYRDRVSAFLKSWLQTKNKEAEADVQVVERLRDQFDQTMLFVESHFPNGFAKKARSKATPRVRFDAIAVGVGLALEQSPTLADDGPAAPVEQWLEGDCFFTLTTSSAANVRSRIQNRTEYVMHKVLGNEQEANEICPA